MRFLTPVRYSCPRASPAFCSDLGLQLGDCAQTSRTQPRSASYRLVVQDLDLRYRRRSTKT
jgi:hypothetical protein